MRLRHLVSFRVLGLLVVGVFAWSLIAWGVAEALIVEAGLRQADAIVVLSGSRAYLERTQKAAELYRQGRAPLILLTDDHTRGGWSSVLQRNPYFVERAREELQKAGVPAEKIRVVPGIASSTRDEAVMLRDYASAQGLHSVLVVTSAYHSRRALWIFRRSCATTGAIVGLEPASNGASTPSTAFWWLQFEGWRVVGGEYLKLIYYWFKYR
jgi:uncharacterized SAM-binding protein YcdF (DUF218 family)